MFKNKKGSALAYMLVIMTAVMIIMVSMLGYISSQLKFSFNRVEKEKAFQIAESGIYFYRWYLAHETSGKTAQQIEAFWNGTVLGDPTAYEADYEGIGKYSIEVTRPNSGSTIVIVKSTGWTYKMPNVKRTVQVRFRRPSWSEYVFLSNSFMNFGNLSVVYGKVHSNSGIRFDGTAYNTVSSLLPRFDDPSHGGSALEFGVHTHWPSADPSAPSYPWPSGTVPTKSNFIGGREFPVPEVSFSGVTADLANMKTEAQAGFGRYFDSTGLGRKITVKSDGTYDVCTVARANLNTLAISRYLASDGVSECNNCSGSCSPSNYPIIDNGVIFVEDNIWLEGYINNKRLSVVAANLSGGGDQADIYIGISNSNLRLAAYDCSNMLGLIAQRNVLVLNDCPDNFVIDAALLAQTGFVGINDNGFSSKTSITFNGAIASYLQPFFQHGVSGFDDRKYYFNNNLLYCPPPYFPTGTEYTIDLWEEL